MRDVAREAGVAEPTVYAIYGSKAGLARAIVDAVETSAELGQLTDELRRTAGDPVGQLAAIVSSDRRLFERGGDVIALLREAGRSQPDLHAAYDEGRARGDRLRQDVFARWSADAFRTATTPATAADTYAALCNIDVYEVLTQERGFSAEQVEQWWRESLHRLLLR